MFTFKQALSLGMRPAKHSDFEDRRKKLVGIIEIEDVNSNEENVWRVPGGWLVQIAPNEQYSPIVFVPFPHKFMPIEEKENNDKS